MTREALDSRHVKTMDVVICIITYQRLNGLARLLAGLNRMTFRLNDPTVRIVVVDNGD